MDVQAADLARRLNVKLVELSISPNSWEYGCFCIAAEVALTACMGPGDDLAALMEIVESRR